MWFSISTDLKIDAEHDLDDIGAGGIIKVYGIEKLSYEVPIHHETGV